MFTRCVVSLLFASFSLISLPLTSSAGIRLLVPSYDYTPGHAEATLGAGISNNETIVGIYVFHGQDVGYLITPDRQFGPSIAVPGALYTNANGVNNAGLVCGNYFPGDTEHGFLFDGSTYTTFDIPGAIYTHVTGVNDAGDFVGFAQVDSVSTTAFMSVAGVVTSFVIPGQNEVYPQTINNLGQIAGYYGGSGVEHGFFRDADGKLAYPLDYPGAKGTRVRGLNDAGLMVGDYGTFGLEDFGFVLKNRAHFISYDYPDEGEHFTIFGGVNNSGVISGFFQDFSGGGTHAFIARVSP